MNNAYWWSKTAEASERAEHPDPHGNDWCELTSDFQLPCEELVNILQEIFSLRGNQVDVSDLEWLAELLIEIFHFGDGEIFAVYNARRPTETEYRLAAKRCLRVLAAIDQVMSSQGPNRYWEEISVALQLPSSRAQQLTRSQIGRQFKLTKMCISKSVKKFLRLAELKPHRI